MGLVRLTKSSVFARCHLPTPKGPVGFRGKQSTAIKIWSAEFNRSYISTRVCTVSLGGTLRFPRPPASKSVFTSFPCL